MSDFHHTVHFWLRDDVTPAQREGFFAALRDIAKSPNVQSCRVGVPAGTDRAVVDNSFDAQLSCVFADKAAHDAYQAPEDEMHTAFLDGHKHLARKVLIYDTVEG